MISSRGGGIIRFLLSGQDTVETFKLDILFFMNWYGYQEETVVVGKKVDILQVMSVSLFFQMSLMTLFVLCFD